MFSSVHTDPDDHKYGAKDIRFCTFTLFLFCESQRKVVNFRHHPPVGRRRVLMDFLHVALVA